MSKEKLLHFHLEDGNRNKKTLIGQLKDGSIIYTFYGGHGSSGVGFSLSNIQYYDLVNGRINWKRHANLPVDTLEDETKEQFKERVKAMLNNSTIGSIKEVKTNVTFAS